MAERTTDRSFGPVVLTGLAAGVLAAVGGNRAWAVIADGSQTPTGDVASVAIAATEASAPLVTAVALVGLAAWGVVLVTRGLFRRLVTWLGLVASVGLVAAAIGAWDAAPDEIRAAFESYGVSGAEVDRTLWSWVSLVASVLALGAAAAACRRVGGWPEMGRRYDAPAPTTQVVEERAGIPRAGADADDEPSNLDLWKAIDEGDDPTAWKR